MGEIIHFPRGVDPAPDGATWDAANFLDVNPGLSFARARDATRHANEVCRRCEVRLATSRAGRCCTTAARRDIAKVEHVDDLTIVVLDRPRHAALIERIRATGARINLISDDDVAGSIMPSLLDTVVDMLLGNGGSPESKQAERLGLDRALSIDNLVQGNDVFFSLTASPTWSWPLLPARATNKTLVMRSALAHRAYPVAGRCARVARHLGWAAARLRAPRCGLAGRDICPGDSAGRSGSSSTRSNAMTTGATWCCADLVPHGARVPPTASVRQFLHRAQRSAGNVPRRGIGIRLAKVLMRPVADALRFDVGPRRRQRRTMPNTCAIVEVFALATSGLPLAITSPSPGQPSLWARPHSPRRPRP